ncbi:hypothetical protein [Hyphomicrobium sulfonivorans]|uniref:hypothetical protein n=1 Tax=Hyphomicrobium sulfonivorans TaxID=121290 RepID=UPI000838E946|nr:hypothetical protein [Hyphomicrobium sulfonivorans]
MTQDWRDRVRQLVEAKGLIPADMNRLLGDGGKGTMYTNIMAGTQPKIENFAKLASVLGTSVGYLYSGKEPGSIELPILGVVENKEMWEALSDKKQCSRLIPLFDSDLVSVQVSTNEMQPTYRSGDLLVGRRSAGSNLDNLIGRDCIIETVKGERFVKFLARGSVAGLYSLRSFDPSVPDVDNASIAWAAPVQMVVRDFD